MDTKSGSGHAHRRRSTAGVTRVISGKALPKIPDHALVRCIGRGSYGEVWLARNVMGTFRAVKIVKRNFFPDQGPFEREFEGLKRFEPISRTDRGFVSILHVGRNERSGYFYCIMEIADDIASGQAIAPDKYEPRTLAADVYSRQRLPLGECLAIGLALASSLKNLHRHGLIHRDLKPSNIIFVNRVPKLADIGLVTTMTRTATSVGTQGYAPPENTGGPGVDLYSLGKVLYQISTGNGPERFPELPIELTAAPAGPQFTRFNEILLRACANDPQNRYASAEAMRVALTQCGRKAAGPVHSDTAFASGTETAPASDIGERRLVTALFIQISRTKDADPEGVQEFMRTCVDYLKPVLQRFGGTMSPFLGDGVMLLFGGPKVCEDHASRAAHAAMAIRQTLETQRCNLESRYGFGFELRFGLNTGLGILGRSRRNHPPSGDVVDLASRIAPLLDPGQIGVAETACRGLKDYFVLRAIGEHRLPANPNPLTIYEVAGTRPIRTRLEAEAERGLTPLVGRAKELALLQERLGEARMGQGQVVLVAGEAGVGKSRLLLEFQRLVDPGDVCWVGGRSFSFGKQMAYLPVIDLVKRFFRIEGADDSETIRDRIEAEAQVLGAELRSALPLIKHLLSVTSTGEDLRAMDATQRRVRTFEAVRNLVLKRAEQIPIVLVVEDLHWIDRTSEEFLVSFADSLCMARVLLVLTYRPEYRNQLPERSFVSRLTLRHLSEQESLQMASRILAMTQLSEQVRKLVVQKAEGNPFFVEEMIKSLLETGVLRVRDGVYELGEAAHRIHVPDTIQDVIMSRIDHLEESPRKALQLASVIGREFAVGLLETIADLPESLAESLRKLKALELIYERSVFPEHTCFFKHALTQEVAYNSLLLQRRKELHRHVAAAVEELYSNRLAEYYDLLAYHYERGEEWERALDYLRRAAERSRGVGAYREEGFQLGRAVAIAQRLGQSTLVAELRGQRGLAWVKIGMWVEAKPELEIVLAETPAENLARRAELLSGLAGACFWGLDTLGTQRYAAESLALAERAGREDLLAGALAWVGATQQALGDLVSATRLFERSQAMGAGHSSAALANYSLALYLSGRVTEAVDQGHKSAQAFRSLSDNYAATFGHPHLGLALAACGLYADAARVFEEAKQMGEKYDIWAFYARALAMSAGFHLEVFDFRGNERLAEEARERARSVFQPSVVSASMDLVFNFARRGDVGQAETLAEETAAAAAKIGGWHQWLWQLRLRQARAEIACARADWAGALECATIAVSESRARGRKKYWAMGLETRARILAGLGRKEEAIGDLGKAINLAREMGDPALFLRTASSMLAIDGDDALLLETRQAARRIWQQLPDADMRLQFETAEPVRRLGPLLQNPVS